MKLMFHLSHVKQVFSQPTDLTHKLILCVHITRAREDFNGDFTEKNLASTEFLTCDIPTQMFYN